MSVLGTLAPTLAHEAGAPDTVAGVQDMVREAVAMRMPLRIVARGTWLDAGHPTARDARPIRVSALTGITEYTPGDLTLTARAGTTLAEINAAVSAERQWLPLDPYTVADHGGTIGATIATASAGPLAHALGLPRDIVLGLEVVTGDGAAVRGGGRVVKNVAGFDLTRLMTGAWGTLGVITEVTVRLRGRPVHDETVVLVRRRSRGLRVHSASAQRATEETVEALRGAAVAPLAAELINAHMARYLEIPDAGDVPIVVMRLAGNADRVRAERATLAAIADVATMSGDVWDKFRRAETTAMSGAAVLRWSQLPAYAATTWAHARDACAAFSDALIHASLGRGIVRAIIPRGESGPLAAAIADETARAHRDGAADGGFAGTCVAERLPTWLWGAAGSHAMRDRLSRRVRRAFDPAHVLNPGILGEGSGHGSDHD